MGEEIERLRSTIEIISANATAIRPKPALRFGMVLYRDNNREDMQSAPRGAVGAMKLVAVGAGGLPPDAKIAAMPLLAAEGSAEGTAVRAEYFGSQALSCGVEGQASRRGLPHHRHRIRR
jgi:hypothetical protein